MKPYTYLIGWSKYNKWYYGARYSKNCHPNDLWNTYFTSSKIVKNLRKELGEPDVIQIRKIFKTREKTCKCEFKILKKIFESRKYDIWINRSFGGQRFGPHTDETKAKMSKFQKTRIHTVEENRKISERKIGIS